MPIHLPNNLTPDAISRFSCEISELPHADEYIFDFGQERRFPPFSMLLLSMVLKRFREDRPETGCRAQNHENHSYAAHLGFFQSFGLRHGNQPGEALGSSTYLPIQRLNISEIREEAFNSFEEVGDVIERKAGELSSILTRTCEGPLHDTLTYSIREIFRNVIEHSGADCISVCAQYWPTKNLVEVGIADSGIGIRSGLANNPAFRGMSNRDALQSALMPGVSGNTRAGQGNDNWQNSGYGLYMTNRICRNGGSFFICSGDSGMTLNAGGKTEVASNLVGTAVRLRINTLQLDNLRAQLDRFADDGRRVAQEIAGANRSFASSASQMLSRDFNLGD